MVDNLNSIDQMNERESIQNSFIITEILNHNGLDIYNDCKKLSQQQYYSSPQQLPSKIIKVQNQSITNNYTNVPKDYQKVALKTNQELSAIENQQLTLTKQLSQTDDELHENENKLEDISAKKSASINKNKIDNLKAENEKLIQEIKKLQEAYNKAKAEFDAYDKEYQIHKEKALEYKKLIKN